MMICDPSLEGIYWNYPPGPRMQVNTRMTAEPFLGSGIPTVQPSFVTGILGGGVDLRYIPYQVTLVESPNHFIPKCRIFNVMRPQVQTRSRCICLTQTVKNTHLGFRAEIWIFLDVGYQHPGNFTSIDT